MKELSFMQFKGRNSNRMVNKCYLHLGSSLYSCNEGL